MSVSRPVRMRKPSVTAVRAILTNITNLDARKENWRRNKMDFKDIIYCVGISILLFEILKSFIFRVKQTDKEKIFFIISIIFSAALFNFICVIIMKPDEVYYFFSAIFTLIFFFIWYGVMIYGRRNYLRAQHKSMKEIYVNLIIWIIAALYFGILIILYLS